MAQTKSHDFDEVMAKIAKESGFHEQVMRNARSFKENYRGVKIEIRPINEKKGDEMEHFYALKHPSGKLYWWSMSATPESAMKRANRWGYTPLQAKEKGFKPVRVKVEEV